MSRKNVVSVLIIVAVALLLLIGVLTLIMVLSSLKDGVRSAEQEQVSVAEGDVTASLDTFLDRSQLGESYIYGAIPGFNDAYSLYRDNEAGVAAASHVSYNVESVSTEAEMGTVRIYVKAPDFEAMINDIMATGMDYTDEGALSAEILSRLGSSYAIVEKTVDCSLKKVGDHWLLIPNADLLNALTGNLYSYHNEMGIDLIEELLGDNND